ncbi:helix-turn-helix domain-containing protein [Wenxinia saemankumensis]|uniref:Helix-turn-helix domain-containing protein n=1 Tax=Wenxinia saemankumensis TaxID=1447782 RepID=A0A1M6EZ75_9RHOB|nr:helix-turn-helix domain-containing protein [Wenxinia saemankumensis]SHI90730.1 Helix-turn-helix domain-containing protein [Wenxinia saemankumensis]
MSGHGADRSAITPRRIAPGEWEARRWEWMESVRRDAGLSATARLVAHALALDYANRATGECNPGPKHIGVTLGFSVDTAKRAIAELVAAGWIVRESNGPGRSNAARISFLSRAQVIEYKAAAAAKKGATVHPFPAQKGAAVPPFQRPEKGANLRGKRGQNCPPNHSKEPYTRGRAREAVDPDASALWWAEQIESRSAVIIQSVSRDMVARIIALGLLTPAELRAAGVAC